MAWGACQRMLSIPSLRDQVKGVTSYAWVNKNWLLYQKIDYMEQHFRNVVYLFLVWTPHPVTTCGIIMSQGTSPIILEKKAQFFPCNC